MSDPITYTLPTIHFNGSGRNNLIADYFAALCALRVALAKLQAVDFHERDYYVKPGAWVRARAERELQFMRLKSVEKYLEAHLDSVIEK